MLAPKAGRAILEACFVRYSIAIADLSWWTITPANARYVQIHSVDYHKPASKDIDECATGSDTYDEGFVCQNLVPKYDCVRPDVPTVCHEPIAPMPGSFQTGRKFNGKNSQVIDLNIAANDNYEFPQ